MDGGLSGPPLSACPVSLTPPLCVCLPAEDGGGADGRRSVRPATLRLAALYAERAAQFPGGGPAAAAASAGGPASPHAAPGQPAARGAAGRPRGRPQTAARTGAQARRDQALPAGLRRATGLSV